MEQDQVQDLDTVQDLVQDLALDQDGPAWTRTCTWSRTWTWHEQDQDMFFCENHGILFDMGPHVSILAHIRTAQSYMHQDLLQTLLTPQRSMAGRQQIQK